MMGLARFAWPAAAAAAAAVALLGRADAAELIPPELAESPLQAAGGEEMDQQLIPE